MNTGIIIRGAGRGAAGALSAICGAAYAALLLGQRGVYRFVPCAVAGAVAGLAAAWLAPGASAAALRPGRAAGWLAAGLLALGSLVLAPGESVLGGWDPGVYIHTGAAVARHGSLRIPAGDLEGVPGAMRRDLSREGPGGRNPFPGMFPLEGGRLSPQFMPLYPSLLAVAHSAAGVRGALRVNPALNAVAILLMYGLASSLLGPGWGAAAALLLALNPAQIWQAKFSTAEMLAQTLLMAGSWAYLCAARGRAPVRAALAAGLLFGLAFLARYDSVLFVVPMAVLAAAFRDGWGDRRAPPVFFAALALMGLHAAWHMRAVAPYYRPLSGLVFPLLGLAAGLGAVLWFAGPRPPLRRLLGGREGGSRALRAAFTLGFLALLAWTGYARPRLAADGRVFRLVSSALECLGRPGWIGALAGGQNAFNFEYLLALYGRIGLLLALAGVLALAWRAPDPGAAAWLLSSASVTALLLLQVFHDPFMMWVSRRFVPVALPLLAVGGAAALREAVRGLGPRRPAAAAGLAAVLLALPLAAVAPRTRAMAAGRDWPGLLDWLEGAAAQVPAGAVVLCDQPGFAAPLRFLHGIRAHEISGGLGCGPFLERHRLALGEWGETVYILTGREPAAPPGVRLRKQADLPLASHILEQPRRSVPLGVRPRSGPLALYEVSADPPAGGGATKRRNGAIDP